jgi:uncharacterized protein YeaO (DUF488 family)
MASCIRIKRAYEAQDTDDGFRVLVDGLWPRGLSKSELHLDLWIKELAPSKEVRESFGHKAENWKHFQEEYRKELRRPEQIARIIDVLEAAKDRHITLLYGAKDTEHNQAVVLAAEFRNVDKKS